MEDSIIYPAISISIVARLIFMYLIYKNRSKNTYSLIFCLMNIGSSGLWMYYSITTNDTKLLVRSISETSLLAISSVYILRNKIADSHSSSSIIPQ